MVKIGVLALQGAVHEHAKMVESEGTSEAVLVKWPEQLEELDGLILPGGESTTMRRLIDRYRFMDALRHFAASGKPIFGTCAGLILMANAIEGEEKENLAIMDVTVERNAFGRQKESFETTLHAKGIADDLVAVFIRAPLIKDVGQDVEVIAYHQEEVVAAKHGQFLACSFHPELTDDPRFHHYFVNMVKNNTKAVV
ncbi:pyridoxal 5'-phosphate synthase glutaminase subunit PdxT [Salicibibacter halophilus]|uniref:Pyridoxal 5'-phosphate synthase subunit PdxT n=1 Tax=Salicibibacter halophilus TaxID=2502791 RepID=A0A514LIF1_9BACI|nr:pyridoxal 5'-phosphate synthase glutaminase subunit PdxT [Salicibibacter halophilus]QDI91628.1 pyridoxal 5'-phosphate synthase glutaminase subunit PdxT [Salicibibacter halophilus]